MTVDLWMLLAAAGLTWLMILVASTPALLKSPIWALSPRDEPLELSSKFAARADRTAQNMKENLPLFAIVVLVVHVAGAANDTSALGAQIFVGARIVHALLYYAGVSVLRTVSWVVSIVGIVMMVSVLF